MITILGIGPGDHHLLLSGSEQLLLEAEVIIGSKRQLTIVPEKKQAVVQLLPKKFTELELYLQENKEKDIILLASGDPLLYGIGVWASKRFSRKELRIFPGISSIHYLFNKEQLSMEDCFLTSSHGKQPNYDLLFSLPKTALVTDQKTGPYELAQEAVKRGLKKKFIIGENLSYQDEQIRTFAAEAVPDEKYEMNVVVIVDER